MQRRNTTPTAANSTTTATEAGMVICTIDTSQLGADQSSQRIHLIPVDANNIVQGTDGRHWTFNADNIKRSASAQKTDLPVDYHHASLDAGVTGAKAPAAGWIDPATIEVDANGVWAEVQWTQAALTSIRDRQFRYLSPVFTHTRNGEIIALKGAALTHYPNLGDLEPVANTQGDHMKELMEEIREALNLPTAANAAEIKTELDKVFGRIGTLAANSSSPLPEQLTQIAARIETAENSAATAANNQLDPTKFVPRVEFDRIDTALNSLVATQESARVETAVNAALEAGKIAPASLEWAKGYCRKDPEGFAAFAANTAQVVPIGEAQHDGAAHGVALSDDEMAFCSQLGITQEDFLKTRAEE